MSMVATCVACEQEEDDAFFTKLDQGRAADVSFVLDQLTGPHPKWRGSALIDASRIGMDGTQHASFTDAAVVADQLGLDFGATTTGTRSMQITRRYNLAMFDLNLRHQPQPLLRGPSTRYPEVTFAAQ